MSLANGDFTPLRLSSEDFPAGERVEATCELYGRAIFGLDVEPLADCPFHVEMTLRAMPDVGVAAGATSRVRCHHTPELIDNDDLIMIVALSGGAIVRQRGQEVTIKDREAVLTTGAETSLTTYPANSQFMNLRFPFNAISPLVADLSTALVRPISRETEALQLLLNYVDGLRDTINLATPEARHLVTTHMHDLAALAIGANREAAAAARNGGVRAARLRAIEADVIENVGRCSLSTDDVAKRHRISARYLRKLFEAEGTSFSNFVLDQRLARARRILIDPRFADRTISMIAFEVGFGDLSYFNRTFRRRYGASPSDVRVAAQRDGNG